MIEETDMTTMTQIGPSYTRNEQMTALRQIIHDLHYVPQRKLARVIWHTANGRIVIAGRELYLSDSFIRNAKMLVRVPLATVYNRIRRITGKIK